MPREVSALALRDILRDRLAGRRLAVFLDYDGTLTPIVDRPELAVLPDATRRVLEALAKAHPVYVISGRDRDDVRELVGVEDVQFVGSHGFHMLDKLPGIDQETLDEAVPQLQAAADELEQWLDYIDGVLIERKKFSFALHYRLVDQHDLRQIKAAAEDVLERYSALTSKKGKKVIEFVPDIPWDKGRCLQALLEQVREQSGGVDVYPIYLGDDVTDEDAFGVLADGEGTGILVAREAQSSAAEFRLPDTDAVADFLQGLVEL